MYASALLRYGNALTQFWPFIAVGIPILVVWAIAPVPPPGTRAAWLRRATPLLLIAVAIACAWRIRWFADDAFISLHYARNWIEGHGLVFNPQERVEGYTNFLWLALIAGCGRLGLDMPLATLALNLLAYAGLIALVHRVVRSLCPDDQVRFSPAAAMTALSYPMVSFATGGLETVFCALLVLAAVTAAHAGRPLASGTCGIAATMAHPDHAVFYAAIAAVLAARALAPGRTRPPGRWWQAPAVRALASYAAPFVVIYVPYFALRWAYYGDPLPNTFYAKTGGGAYFVQGLRYLFASALVAGALGVLPAFAVGAHWLRRTMFGQIVAVALPLYLLYVASIGGDFMIGRLIVAVLPLVFVVAEVGVRAARARPVRAALLATPFVLACLPTTFQRPQQLRWMMSDERTYWQIDTLSPLTLRGAPEQRARALLAYFPDAGPSLSYAAHEIGYLAWRTRFRIVDLHGLIDRELAHLPVAEHGRPGHEHAASADHVRARGAMLSKVALYLPPYAELTALTLDGVRSYLVRYDEALLAPLRGRPGAMFTDLPRYLDTYITHAASVPGDRFAADLAFFDTYYFATSHDTARRAALLAARTAPPP